MVDHGAMTSGGGHADGRGSRRTPARWPAPVLIAMAVVAALLYCNFLIDWALRGFEGMGEVVSLLEAPGEPNAGLLRITDVVCAGLVLLLLPLLRAALPPGRPRSIALAGLVVFAVGSALAAAVPPPCGPGGECNAPGDGLQSFFHDGFSVVAEAAFFISVAAVWFIARSTGPTWLRRTALAVFWVGGVLGDLVFLLVWSVDDESWVAGAAQRVHLASMGLWIVALTIAAVRQRPTGPDHQHSPNRREEKFPP